MARQMQMVRCQFGFKAEVVIHALGIYIILEIN